MKNPIPFSEALKHRAALRAYAVRCTHSLGLGHLYDVDDLLQATWCRALERWDGPHGPRDPHPRAVRSWLHRMMFRHMQTEGITNQRRRRILSVQRMDVMTEVHGADADAQPARSAGEPEGLREDHFYDNRDKRYLRGTETTTLPNHNAGSRACHDPRAALAARIDAKLALAALSPSTRTLVVRAHAAGDEYQEIADDVGLPVSTVTARLHRGRLVAAAVLGVERGAPAGAQERCPAGSIARAPERSPAVADIESFLVDRTP